MPEEIKLMGSIVVSVTPTDSLLLEESMIDVDDR
jgi:hypothetical protein